MSKIFLTSDQHFGHRNVIVYENRPFSDTLDMRNHLVDNWNSVVNDDDLVVCLGDFSFLDKNTTKTILESLNGSKWLIKGNHDRHGNQWYTDVGFEKVLPNYFMEYNGKKILFTHRPTSIPTEFQKSRDYDLHIYGHVHAKGNENLKYPTFAKNGACVCVERTDYRPILLDEVIQNCNSSDFVFSEGS